MFPAMQATTTAFDKGDSVNNILGLIQQLQAMLV
jgi:hypothetical protein